MAIPARDLDAIAGMRLNTIERYCRRLGARFEDLLPEGGDVESHREELQGVFVSPLVRTIPLAAEFRDLCITAPSHSSVEQFHAAVERMTRIAATMSLRVGVMLSFDETISLRDTFENGYLFLRPSQRRPFSTENVQARADEAREPLRARLLAFGYTEEHALTMSYVLSRLRGACELLMETTEELLRSRSKQATYVAGAFLMALLIEIYGRSYELVCTTHLTQSV